MTFAWISFAVFQSAWVSAEENSPVQIRQERNYWRVTVAGDPVIEAQIAQDGALVDLRFLKPDEIYDFVPNAHRPSFVRTGAGLPDQLPLGGSRGVFFLGEESLVLDRVGPKGASGVLAESDRASLLYEFQPGSVRITATNASTERLSLLMVVDPSACVVEAPGRDLVQAPAIKWWPETTWYQDAGSAWWKIRVLGGDRIWGQSVVIGQAAQKGMSQVWEAILTPGETRQVEIKAVRASEDEVSIARKLVPEPVEARRTPALSFTVPKFAEEGEITLFSPTDYRVFQRATRTAGKVLVSGRVRKPCKTVDVRFSGKSLDGELPDQWTAIPVNSETGGFLAEIPVPAGGWFRLEVRSPNGETSVSHVGVGEVFVICGQSNSTNYGEGLPEPNRTRTGLVAAFSGEDWSLCVDPLPGTTDNGQGGSPWPYFGDAMVERFGVPVAIAATGQGGAPVQNWRPGRFPFFWLMTRIHQLGPGGFRALLWHQGESNSKGPAEEYYQSLSGIIRASRRAAGWDIPWFVAQVSYRNPKEPMSDSTRSAQKKLWDEGVALEGPDTDTLRGEAREGVHLSVLGLKLHGRMWEEKVGAYLDKVLDAPNEPESVQPATR